MMETPKGMRKANANASRVMEIMTQKIASLEMQNSLLMAEVEALQFMLDTKDQKPKIEPNKQEEN